MGFKKGKKEMERKQMKPLRVPNTKETSEYMRNNLAKNKKKSKYNKAENWMGGKLDKTKFKWTRQAMWGYRIFDFWCHHLGIAIEVDGPEHEKNKDYDSYRDEYNFRRSGILVFRVRNMNEEDAKAALELINTSDTWSERRQSLGIYGNRKQKMYWVTEDKQGDLFV